MPAGRRDRPHRRGNCGDKCVMIRCRPRFVQRDARCLRRQFHPAVCQIDLGRPRLLALARSRADHEGFRRPGYVHDRSGDELDLHLRAIRYIDDVAILNTRAFDELVPAHCAQHADIPVQHRHYSHVRAVTERGREKETASGKPGRFHRGALYDYSPERRCAVDTRPRTRRLST